MASFCGILGKKLGMSQTFSEDGTVEPVTVIEAGPCRVMQVRTAARDGYAAVQLGFGDRKRKRATKPEIGHARKTKTEPKKFVREIRVDTDPEVKEGEEIGVALLKDVALVDVTGITKGKGTAGVMKRWGFHGLSASHGTHRVHRSPGSIGAAADPGRAVRKGKRMPGRMGAVRRTVRKLAVVGVDEERNLLLIRGGVPGPNGGYLIVRASASVGKPVQKKSP